MRIIANWLAWATSWVLIVLATWIALWYTLHLVIIPWLLARFTRLRAAEISLLSGRAVEWRSKAGATHVVPKIRVEKYGWAWGGAQVNDTGGLITFKVEGVCLRMDMSEKNTDAQRPSKRSASMGEWPSRILYYILHLAIHHYPSVARIVSIQVTDFCIVLEDLGGLELGIKDFRAGLKVNFEGKVESGEPLVEQVPLSPETSARDFRRANPLASPRLDLSPTASPPVSPLTPFSSFSFQLDNAAPVHDFEPPRVSRMTHARRRASVFQSRMTSTVASVWSRAIGRAHGSVSLSTSFENVTVTLPCPAPKPLSRTSKADESRAKLLRSAGSFHSMLHKFSRPALAMPSGDAESLIALDGTSQAVLYLGFGPKKGLLGEDTLRTDVKLGKLSTSLNAVEKLQALLKAVKKPIPQSSNANPKAPWYTKTLLRTLLRAFESVSVSLDRLAFTHQLPTVSSSPASASSSVTDMTEISARDDTFTISLDAQSLFCRLYAADSSTNQRARNAFGTNTSPDSKVRGIGFGIGWHNVGLQCVAPGERSDEMSQLIQMRSAELEGLSTWRPQGWSREELLFSSDPNLALVVQKGTIDSIDIACDLQLLNELRQSWKQHRPFKPPPRKEPAARDPRPLPPRFRIVLDVGHAMVLLADRVSQQKTTLTLASDGFHFGCFTGFNDIVARRRDKSENRSAFRREEELSERREQVGDDADYSLPPSMLKPELRRHPTHDPAVLQDDYSISMRCDGTLVLEPISLHMTLSGEEERDQQTYRIAAIGRTHGTLTGDVLGRCDVDDSGKDIASLDWGSASWLVDVGIDSGVKFTLWDMPVITALVAMGESHRFTASDPVKTPQTGSLLDRLPSGLSVRFSLGMVSLFVGHLDPNPDCEAKLARGLWIQATLLAEYAYYNRRAQVSRRRQTHNAANRARLGVQDDITAQAQAFENYYGGTDGRAALVAATLTEAVVKPIFNGQKFTENGCLETKMRRDKPMPRRKSSGFGGWEFRHSHAKEPIGKGKFANNIEPFDISDSDQASRPLVQAKRVNLRCNVHRRATATDIEFNVTSRVDGAEVVCDLSHIYCALLAATTVQKLVKAGKRSQQPKQPKQPINMSLDATVPSAKVHLAFPLHEQLYVYIGNVNLSKPPKSGVKVTAGKVLAFVPSARRVGSWEELVRIKALDVRSAAPDETKSFAVNAEAFRVQIPVGYQLSRLVLNISVTVKSLKLLMRDLNGRAFDTILKPGAEQPKRIPTVLINISRITFEAEDNPIETKMNLIWRAGVQEQKKRNELEDSFETKIRILEEIYAARITGVEPVMPTAVSKLTGEAMRTPTTAREKLDEHKNHLWRKRIRVSKQEQQRQEEDNLRHLDEAGLSLGTLPIKLVERPPTAPLFRLALHTVEFCISDLGWTRNEVIKYMSEVSAPFSEGVEFSLMVPIRLKWSFNGGTASLRDYPLPLVRIPSATSGDKPSWHVDTPYIIAQEVSDDDSLVFVPVQVIPSGCGAKDASPFTVQIAKTIMPLKTYSRPIVNVTSDRTTEFTWGNSYQPAIQDFMKVIESLSHPPRDPSPRVGFWDKFRLILHWKVTLNFTGSVHLHLKGMYQPYEVVGHGAGFAFSWNGGTRIEINQPNEQREAVQFIAEELLIAIPDLTSLQDTAAVARSHSQPDTGSLNEEQSLIERRYTKPCARFLNGVRVGFGFVFERTCRPWNCEASCGDTMNLFHRQCRLFDFKQHQDVVLRSPNVVKKEEERLGREFDSYEGFRSDYIHFSVSVVAPLNPPKENAKDNAENQNSLHLTPKAFAHFFAWWRLFNHTMSLPIRQGKLFPQSPPPSKKFGRSLGTIKFRFDLAPVYVSHMYFPSIKHMWSAGKSQSLGIKGRIASFKADAHMRIQEKTIRHEKLHTTRTLLHKAFYAADLLLSGIEVKGIRADFTETTRSDTHELPQAPKTKVSELSVEKRTFYNFFDFIDADKKPFDMDPEVDVVDMMDCPQVFASKRNKVRQTTPYDGEDQGNESENAHGSKGSENGKDSRFNLESSKFGHEKSHICYLGAAKSVSESQISITKDRIAELEARRLKFKDDHTFDHKTLSDRLRTLYKYINELVSKEDRQIDNSTFEEAESKHPAERTMSRQGETTHDYTLHIHCPRVYYNNLSRNMIFAYWYCSRDRRQEEYMTEHRSLRGIRDGLRRRMQRQKTGNNRDDLTDDQFPTQEHAATHLLTNLQRMLSDKSANKLFQLPSETTDDAKEMVTPKIGLPEDCLVKPDFSVLVLKPQLALRSEAEENAIILLAVEEVWVKGFKVEDVAVKDDVAAEVLSRIYVAVKGLQAFYPTAEALQRERDQSLGRLGLDFIPLEIFLDVRSEATDYDRIISKSDAAISYDRFNHLRMPRGLDWPQAKDEWGQDIQHLRLHQDLFTIIIPRLQVSATSKHYNALYYIITDLCVYEDPGHRERAERIDSFQFAFDRDDRDPNRHIFDLFNLQQSIRALSELRQGYEANADMLTEEGLTQLFNIRNDCREALEQLFTVFEAISVNKARDEARAALKSASRLDVRVGGIAWHMLRDDFKPLLKIDVGGTLFSGVSNKDGSNDNAIAFGDLSALNSDHDAYYPEVLVRYDQGNKKRTRESFASAAWSILAPVGGITMVRHTAFYLYPVRFRLEERVGHQVMDYIFSDRVERRKNRERMKRQGHVRDAPASVAQHTESHRSNGAMTRLGTTDAVPLVRSKSQASIATVNTTNGSTNGDGNDRDRGDSKFAVDTNDASEMRRRAKGNKTFIKILVGATSFVLSYKSDDRKKNHRAVVSWSMPDCVDFKLKTPEMSYTNKVWGYEDVFEHVKRDIRSYVWSQTGDLLGQLFKKTSLFRSKKGLKSLALSTSEMRSHHKSITSSSSTSPSSLRYTVQPPTPMEDEVSANQTLALARALSRDASSSLARVRSRAASVGRGGSGPQVLGVSLAEGSNGIDDIDEDDRERDVAEKDEKEGKEEGGMRKTVKGLVGKLKKHTSKFDLSSISNGSSDELSRTSLDRDRLRRTSNTSFPASPPHMMG